MAQESTQTQKTTPSTKVAPEASAKAVTIKSVQQNSSDISSAKIAPAAKKAAVKKEKATPKAKSKKPKVKIAAIRPATPAPALAKSKVKKKPAIAARKSAPVKARKVQPKTAAPKKVALAPRKALAPQKAAAPSKATSSPSKTQFMPKSLLDLVSKMAQPVAMNKLFSTTNPTPNFTMEAFMSKNPNQPFEKIAQDAASFSREQFDAMTKSYSILAKGYENIFRTSMQMSQSAAEKQANFAKQVMSCKTINEFTEMQNKAAQSTFEDFMSGVTQISEMSAKVMTEVSEPLNDQMGKVMKKVNEAA